MKQILARRAVLEAAFGLAVLAMSGGRAFADNRKGSSPEMGKDIVMVHGANEGGWCFDKFNGFETRAGPAAPDLIGHGGATDAKTSWSVSAWATIWPNSALAENLRPLPSCRSFHGRLLIAPRFGKTLILIAPRHAPSSDNKPKHD
jgi:hypothetical protein